MAISAPLPLAPSLRLAVSPRRRISQTVPFFPVPVRAAGADTRAGQSNPAAAKTADEAPPRPLDDASIMRALVAEPRLRRPHCHPRFPFAPMAAKLSSPTRPRFSTMTAPLPPKPVNLPAEPPLTRMSNELASLRASVNKLARAQNALLFNVKALERPSAVVVGHGPADGEHDEWESWRGRSAAPASLASLPATPDQP